MFIVLFIVILLISLLDLRKIVQQKHTRDLVFYLTTAFFSLLYCYYYVNHEMSASSVQLILRLMGM